jgi:hypothetical protein
VPLNGRNAVHGRVSRPDDLTPAAPHALLRAATKGFAADGNPTHDLEEKTEGIDVTDANLLRRASQCCEVGFVTINP